MSFIARISTYLNVWEKIFLVPYTVCIILLSTSKFRSLILYLFALLICSNPLILKLILINNWNICVATMSCKYIKISKHTIDVQYINFILTLNCSHLLFKWFQEVSVWTFRSGSRAGIINDRVIWKILHMVYLSCRLSYSKYPPASCFYLEVNSLIE